MLPSNQASVSVYTKSCYHSLTSVNMANFIPNIVNLVRLYDEDDDSDLFTIGRALRNVTSIKIIIAISKHLRGIFRKRL